MISKQTIQRLANNPFIKFFNKIDTKISENFCNAGVNKRLVSGNGVWCSALIPSILIMNTFMFPVSKEYKLTAYLSLGLFVHSILYSIFLYLSSLILREPMSSGVTAASFIAAIPMCMNMDSVLVSLIFAALSTVCYCHLLQLIILNIQNTFTPGEAMVVCQEVVLYVMYSILSFYLYIYEPESVNVNKDMFILKMVLMTAYTTAGLIVIALYMLADSWRGPETLIYLFLSATLYGLIAFHFLVGITAIPQLFGYLLRDLNRVKLLLVWAILVVVAVIIVFTHTISGSRADSSTRKIFHLLAALVFLTGILNDINLLLLSAGVVFALLIMIEALRLSNIEPVSAQLQAAFEVYSDEKDAGVFAVTPMYLYVGLACPLMLVPCQPGRELELLSGFLSIGVGDAAASYFGERSGQTYWPNSNKTLEGTMCNILSQLVVVFFLQTFELLNVPAIYLRTGIAATVSALVEALTDQVDNLILPLVTILAFQVTGFVLAFVFSS